MASSILSDNGVSSGSAGIKTTADSTGALALQTTTAGGAATTAVTIDTSQNVGIGTSSPAAKLDVAFSGEALRLSGSTTLAYIRSVASGVNQWYVGSGGTAGLQFYTYTATPMTFSVNGSEAARIDSSGNLLVGTTTAIGSGPTVVFKGPAIAGQQQLTLHNPATSGTRFFQTFGTEAGYTERGYITWNGSTMALSNASDERLKENIVDSPSALPKIAALQIRSFDFKEDGRHVDYGVIAQELESVIPSAVFKGSETEDGEMDKPWSVGLEPIIPVLVKAIQEQQALITTLTERITALEAK